MKLMYFVAMESVPDFDVNPDFVHVASITPFSPWSMNWTE